MTGALVQHLTALYGVSLAASVAREISRLLDAWRSRQPCRAAPRRTLDLTPRDALLITYADQVHEPGVPPLQTLGEFCARHLKRVVSGVHLLPFYPSSSDDGFSVKDFLAVDPAQGTWEDVSRLGADFDLMFDAVFNHVSAQGDWFRRFLADDPEYRDFFVTVQGAPDLSQVVRPRALPLLTEFTTVRGPQRVWTTFSADQVDLNFRNPKVLLRVLEALLFYVAHGARFIRLDAIAFLWKHVGTPCLHLPQTHTVIRLFREVLDAVAPDVRLITETNVPHADNLTYFGDGTNEAQLVYNFALPPLVLHSFASADAESLTRWAQSLALPSHRVTFLNFLASHDGIGLNPVRGILCDREIEALVRRVRDHGGLISDKHLPDGSSLPYELNINYLDALSNPATDAPPEQAARPFLTAHAILLSLQGMPALYFHSLFGSRGDRAGAELTGIPRRINRQQLARTELEAALADPGSLRAQVHGALSRLLRLRRAHRAFAPHSSQGILALDRRVFAVLRRPPAGDRPFLCLHNVSADAVSVRLPYGGQSGDGDWVAPGAETAACATACGGSLTLPPLGFRWLAWRREAEPVAGAATD
jgi:sucrose phosphorylase